MEVNQLYLIALSQERTSCGVAKDSMQAGAAFPFSQFWSDRNDNEALHRIALLGQSEWRLVAPLFSDWLRRLGCPEAAHQWDQTGLSFQLQAALLDQWKKDGHPQISWPEIDAECSWEVAS
jgi:hypothetical protein